MMSQRLGLSHDALLGHVRSLKLINKSDQHRYMRFHAAMVLTDIVHEVSAAQQHAKEIWLTKDVR